jgi:hypothetical protein
MQPPAVLLLSQAYLMRYRDVSPALRMSMLTATASLVTDGGALLQDEVRCPTCVQ